LLHFNKKAFEDNIDYGAINASSSSQVRMISRSSKYERQTGKPMLKSLKM